MSEKIKVKKTYSEKLKDPRWQKKRLEILSRDNWQCQVCWDKTKTLHVHHTTYVSGKDPWEYDDCQLLSLCDRCHISEHFESKQEFLKNITLEIEDLLAMGALKKDIQDMIWQAKSAIEDGRKVFIEFTECLFEKQYEKYQLEKLKKATSGEKND